MIPFTLPSWRMVKLALGGIALAWLGLQLITAKVDARHWKKQYAGQVAARAADQAAMVAATRQATFDALMNVYRTQAARAAINERSADALALDRDRAVTAYQRLQQRADAHIRAPGGPDLSAQREATCHAVAGTSCNRIPALLKAAQDNTDQLLALIRWVEEQAAVPTVPSTTPDPAAPPTPGP